ncbi:MAG TPA: TRAP transporter small permease subunit [Dehalococcoidales bacterium]|nr:TRAP transporter small permease subunit [Dehalococcoidales bacterium]
MKVWNKLGQAVDLANEWMGRLAWALILFLMCFGVYDVIRRYIFNAPTVWGYVVLKMGLVALAAIGGGYALKRGSFVRVDILYARWSRRGKAIADIATFAFVALFCVIGIWYGIDMAHFAITTGQVTANVEQFPMGPVKSLIPLGIFLVLLVVVKTFVSDIRVVFHRRENKSLISHK